MCGWGLWGNMLKGPAGDMRIQSFYWLFILGVFIVSLIVCFSAGEVKIEDNGLYGMWSFTRDDFKASGKNVIIAILAGVVFNIANLGLTICINLIGLAIAFGIIIGMGFVTGTIFAKYITPSYVVDNSNTGLMWGGIVMGGIATVGFAYMNYLKDAEAKGLPSALPDAQQLEDGITTAEKKADKKIYILCFASGLLMSFWGCIMGFANFDLLNNPEGLSPYGTSFYFNIGCVISAPVILPLTLGYDVDGKGKTDVQGWIQEMKATPLMGHVMSFLGGVVWSIGWMGFTLNNQSPTLTPAIAYSVGQCATLVAIISGICWGEFKGTSMKIKILTAVDCAFFV